MPYTIENGMWRSVFAVPGDIVDLHLKLCGEVQLKVLLALLRYNGGLDAASLSSIVGRPEPVVQEAVDYWTNLGVFKNGSQTQEARPVLRYEEIPALPEIPPEPPAENGQKITALSSSRRKFDRDEINRLSESDENIAYLLQESQSILGKTLSAVATDTVVALYSYYGMKPDLILMILQYCVGIGKANMRYIEKVAASWIEGGIDSHEQAEAEIQRQTSRHTMQNRIKSAFGIYDRNLIPTEKKYIEAWVNEFHMDIPLITLAFERTVETKGKLSFPYINGILANWHAKGVTTPAQAMRDTRADAPQKTAPKAGSRSSYDIGELEERLNQGAF